MCHIPCYAPQDRRVPREGCLPQRNYILLHSVMSVLQNHASQSALLSLKEKFVKEVESTKIKEDELVKCLPLLQVAEEACKSKHRELEELNSILTGTYEALSDWPQAQLRISLLFSHPGGSPVKARVKPSSFPHRL